MPKIRVAVKDGAVRLVGVGFSGDDCKESMNRIAAAIGIIQEVKPHEENLVQQTEPQYEGNV